MPDNKSIILIFAAEPIVAELTSHRLQLLDLHPIVLNNEQEFEEQLAACLPSLIMIDLDLTEFSAMALIEKLSSDELTSRIPVLCMSAEGDLDRAERAFQAGAREFLVLPYDPLVMEQKLLRSLANAQALALEA